MAIEAEKPPIWGPRPVCRLRRDRDLLHLPKIEGRREQLIENAGAGARTSHSVFLLISIANIDA